MVARMSSRLLNAVEAARYCGVGRTHFLTQVRPYLKGEVNVAAPQRQKPMPRWTVEDLDAWIATRRREKRSA